MMRYCFPWASIELQRWVSQAEMDKRSNESHEGAVRKVRAALPKYVATLMRDDPEYAARVQRALEISKPVVDDLVRTRYDVLTISDLAHTGRRWDTAIPILAALVACY